CRRIDKHAVQVAEVLPEEKRGILEGLREVIDCTRRQISDRDSWRIAERRRVVGALLNIQHEDLAGNKAVLVVDIAHLKGRRRRRRGDDGRRRWRASRTNGGEEGGAQEEGS